MAPEGLFWNKWESKFQFPRPGLNIPDKLTYAQKDEVFGLINKV